jgi:hypothetical protein
MNDPKLVSRSIRRAAFPLLTLIPVGGRRQGAWAMETKAGIKGRGDITFRALLRAVTVVAALGCMTAAAQAPEPKTVADFLLLVPERFMDGYDLRFREEMLRGAHRGVIVDIPNGYISYDASDNPSGFEFAIFRKNDGRYLVAYSTGAFYDPDFGMELGTGPPCSC